MTSTQHELIRIVSPGAMADLAAASPRLRLMLGTILIVVSLLSCGTARAAGANSCTSTMIAGMTRCLHAGDGAQDCAECPELVVVPAGSFAMGSPDSEDQRSPSEGPRHTVSIAKPFAVGRYEVTFAEWDACIAEGGCTYRPRDAGWGRGRRPVVNVSWDDIKREFLPWLAKKSGYPYRLLSEAEWEYCARAGTSTPFATGATISSDQANFDGSNTYGGSAPGAYRKRTLEVGSFPPNAFGLSDTAGNVAEWVQDCFTEGYGNAPADGRPSSDTAGCQRVLRGGSWLDGPRVLRSAYRGHLQPNARFILRGFRVARDL
jgi:formylglycine-generating enzyme required for sulfatase activity